MTDVAIDAQPAAVAEDAAALQEQARQAYRDALAAGDTMTGAQLGVLFARSPRWGRDRRAEVDAERQAAPAATGSRPNPGGGSGSRSGSGRGCRCTLYPMPRQPMIGWILPPAAAVRRSRVPRGRGSGSRSAAAQSAASAASQPSVAVSIDPDSGLYGPGERCTGSGRH